MSSDQNQADFNAFMDLGRSAGPGTPSPLVTPLLPRLPQAQDVQDEEKCLSCRERQVEAQLEILARGLSNDDPGEWLRLAEPDLVPEPLVPGSARGEQQAGVGAVPSVPPTIASRERQVYGDPLLLLLALEEATKRMEEGLVGLREQFARVADLQESLRGALEGMEE
ncbi:hypothetical protein LTR62_008569 [Meristemomyces frigidus]|uniref:Uncharacterized protein n=1 Tax=Meristemomyces frigidus TaxID=1508187 RepID=A0AAN7TH75_9PEZI|nr:hypothetical protein LTR62_008569 [Meristemomyces frigidus]